MDLWAGKEMSITLHTDFFELTNIFFYRSYKYRLNFCCSKQSACVNYTNLTMTKNDKQTFDGPNVK